MTRYSVVFPPDLGEYEWAEIEAKGWLADVQVLHDGDRHVLDVYDTIRLPQAIHVDVLRLGYFAASKLLVVPSVTREAIESAVRTMAARGFADLGRNENGRSQS